MVRNRRSVFALATAVIALGCGLPAAASAQAVTEVLRDLIQTHPQILSKQKSVGSAVEGIGVARSGYYPSVTVTGDSGPEYVDSPTRRQTEGHRYYKGRETSGLTITQKIFDGFATDSGVEAAKYGRDMAAADLRLTRQSVILEGVLAYVDVLRQNRLIQLFRDSERKVLEQLNLEDERVQKGAGMANDVLAAKQRLQRVMTDRISTEGDFLTAVAKYSQVFGHAPDLARMSDPPVPADLIPPEMEEVIRTAQAENPQLEQVSKKIDKNAELRNAAEAGYYPALDLIGKANYENDKNATIGVRRDWSLLLTATWELFSGFSTNAAVAAASYDHAAAMDDRFHASRKLTESAKIYWHQLETARKKMALTEQEANLAEELWEGQKKRREAGKATAQDVLDDETKINDARVKYARAYYEVIQHSYELLFAMGRLEVDNVDRLPPAGGPVSDAPQSLSVPPLAAEPVVPTGAPEPMHDRVGRLLQDSSQQQPNTWYR
ncbi:TolC family protein [Magnetospirillum sp. UT-4]|uniref:TolC family protein n=1 Tax=Magnetospirillum sp. UT-4 TaxID=2681467 RepID=UPI00137F7FC0|nr:TolC family protein [Magnetospirillum sp. UT-4]CAA7614211.1 Outer membrane protein [Magnetospirillum sp. UT-4]